MSALIGVIAEELPATTDPSRDLEHLAKTFLVALMQPRVLRLRRLVISSADRFPEISSAWYEQGFERVLAALAASFRALADRHLLAIDDVSVAAEHFVGMLFWIPVNKAMFTGDDDYAANHDLVLVARTAAAAFMKAYGNREVGLSYSKTAMWHLPTGGIVASRPATSSRAPALGFEGGPDDPVMIGQELCVRVVPETPQQRGGALDVGEEERQRLDARIVRRNPRSRLD